MEVGCKRIGKLMSEIENVLEAFVSNDPHRIVHCDFVKSVGRIDHIPSVRIPIGQEVEE